MQQQIGARIEARELREQGQSMVEYALILGLLVVGCIAALGLLGVDTLELWDFAATEADEAFGD